MNRKSAMTRRKRTPNCWRCFKVRIVILLDHPYIVFTTQKTPTKWSARKLQRKAITKWCWIMWCGRLALYYWLLLSLSWLLVSFPRDIRSAMKDWTVQHQHYSRLTEYKVQKLIWSRSVTTWERLNQQLSGRRLWTNTKGEAKCLQVNSKLVKKSACQLLL